MKYIVSELQFIATKAWHEDGMVCIRLQDGREIRFPVYFNSKLRNATAESVGKIEIICGGTGLHWPDLNEDLSVMGIMDGRLGKP